MRPPADLHIRPAVVADAEALVAYMHRLTNEPHNNITLDPGQWAITVEQEREYLAHRNSDPAKGIYAIAEMQDQLVAAGQLDRGAKPANRHSAMLGISVDAAWRRKGIGRRMMAYFLDWARGHGLVRVELKVFSRNTGAIELYRQCGFVEEGRHPYACCKQGVWVEDVTMGLILRESLPAR